MDALTPFLPTAPYGLPFPVNQGGDSKADTMTAQSEGKITSGLLVRKRRKPSTCLFECEITYVSSHLLLSWP